jgi:translation initiation factor 2 beta subunit (eIF-2beta)/eIF-5|tara:strand:+ start:954 stop:1139 length:186 start_codon:yes stop_codon:yes gene_type:complete
METEVLTIRCECGACVFFSRIIINIVKDFIKFFGICFTCGSRITVKMTVEDFIYGGIDNEA